MSLSDADSELACLSTEAHLQLGPPALGAGVVYGDGTDWRVALGHADVARGLPCTATTPFRIGSVTKTFTAAAALLLVERGALALDAPVLGLLPELGRLRSHGHPLEGITLRRLLTHTSGLVSDPPTRDWYAERFPSIDELLAALPQTDLVVEPGTRRKYSNLGYALVGELITRAAGIPYTSFVEEEILVPLQLRATHFRDDGSAAASGYTGRPGDGRHPLAIRQPDLGGEAPSGQLFSTVPDLLRWLAFQLGHLRSPALPHTVLERLHAPVGVAEDLDSAWSLGWGLVRNGERVMHLHGGGVNGFTCAIAFDASARTGAVLLTNGEVSPDPIAVRLLETARRLGPAPTIPPAENAAKPPDQTLLGSYDGVLTQRLNVTLRSGMLVASGGLVDHPRGATLRPAGADTYLVGAGRFAGELLHVRREADGDVRELHLSDWRYTRVNPGGRTKTEGSRATTERGRPPCW